MTIYEALKKDHDQVQDVLIQLAAAESAESRQRLIEQVRDLLVPHSRAEEAVFYNVLRDIPETKEVVAHAYGEHVMAETVLRGLQITEAVHLNWKAGVEKLRHELGHHIAEEEGKIFSAAKKVLSLEEAKAIGKAFRQLKPKLGAGLVSSQVELMVNLLPQRLRKSVSQALGMDHARAS